MPATVTAPAAPFTLNAGTAIESPAYAGVARTGLDVHVARVGFPIAACRTNLRLVRAGNATTVAEVTCPKCAALVS